MSNPINNIDSFISLSHNTTSQSSPNLNIQSHTHITDPPLSPNSPPTLNISSINANRSLKKNLHLYINLLINKNIDILLIQEPGPFLNSSVSNSTNQVPYHLTQAQYNCIAQTHHNNSYSLLE